MSICGQIWALKIPLAPHISVRLIQRLSQTLTNHVLLIPRIPTGVGGSTIAYRPAFGYGQERKWNEYQTDSHLFTVAGKQ